MIKFSHPIVGDLVVRLNPTEIEWTYNLNTSIQDTYAGQVIQLLGMNFDKMILHGRLGMEGPHGRETSGTIGGPIRSVDQFRDISRQGGLRVGLTQMTEYFRHYFSVASQGNDPIISGNFNQQWMVVGYGGGIDAEEQQWHVYPVDFPSYHRSLENFAPEWQIEFEVVEGPTDIKEGVMSDALKRLRDGIGYTPFNKFSDPLGALLPSGSTLTQQAIDLATKQNSTIVDQVFDHLKVFLPEYSISDIQQLILSGASLPNLYVQQINSLATAATQSPIAGATPQQLSPTNPEPNT